MRATTIPRATAESEILSPAATPLKARPSEVPVQLLAPVLHHGLEDLPGTLRVCHTLSKLRSVPTASAWRGLGRKWPEVCSLSLWYHDVHSSLRCCAHVEPKPGRLARPYSPECVEDKFHEVRGTNLPTQVGLRVLGWGCTCPRVPNVEIAMFTRGPLRTIRRAYRLPILVSCRGANEGGYPQLIGHCRALHSVNWSLLI